MPDETARDYYQRRAESATKLAEAAADPGIRKIHLGMAQAYEQRAVEAVPKTRPTLSAVMG